MAFKNPTTKIKELKFLIKQGEAWMYRYMQQGEFGKADRLKRNMVLLKLKLRNWPVSKRR